jgi:hypothetical protein
MMGTILLGLEEWDAVVGGIRLHGRSGGWARWARVLYQELPPLPTEPTRR